MSQLDLEHSSFSLPWSSSQNPPQLWYRLLSACSSGLACPLRPPRGPRCTLMEITWCLHLPKIWDMIIIPKNPFGLTTRPEWWLVVPFKNTKLNLTWVLFFLSLVQGQTSQTPRQLWWRLLSALPPRALSSSVVSGSAPTYLTLSRNRHSIWYQSITHLKLRLHPRLCNFT